MTPALAATPTASPPRVAPPAGACDAHCHVFGPVEHYPTAFRTVYPLPDAPAYRHKAFHALLGLDRGVLTQPAPYGVDPSAMLAAIDQSGGALRGVAVADTSISDSEFLAWRQAGVVGLRFSETRAPDGGRYPGSVGFETLVELAPQLRSSGLHAQLWAPALDLIDHLPRLLTLGVTLVLDHMGSPDAALGADDSTFQRLLAMCRDAGVWAKLVVCRVSRAPGYLDVRPFQDAWMSAMPERLVWGSDWPFVRMQPAPDAGALLDLFYAWTPDIEMRDRVLVTNPARLYGFRVGEGGIV